jgi:hypothetical protein
MTISVAAIARHTIRVSLALPLLLAACASPASPALVPVVDFIKEFDRADRRPPDAYTVASHVSAGSALPAIVGPAPGRLAWELALPRGGEFRARVAVAGAHVRIRVGVSDARIYEQLAERTVGPGEGWSLLTANLSAYAGRKISLFYRPDERRWRVNLSADAIEGPATVAWGRPEVVTTGRNVAEYVKRRARIR